ncbi:hypothetical protein [Lactococcus termiticola]|uniref:Uncharacterized protein n=1 Tax=Lactococcus termiticola TaxID=2169526 RepID=A0A2R5HJP1_9LACT|nr:hypothetical protein [Lactococcus termiticola]GBG96531.1 hypothetical protein NtB2_00644 [Lactococcus termiticola]
MTKFVFKGISAFEGSEQSFVGAVAESHQLTKEFADLKAALQFVADNNGFVISEDGKSGFMVLSVKEA